jgi:hypothetical protein
MIARMEWPGRGGRARAVAVFVAATGMVLFSIPGFRRRCMARILFALPRIAPVSRLFL